ncbi:MAG: acyl-CoA carboxylase subunit epsilon [Nocardioidaceae bacterium]
MTAPEGTPPAQPRPELLRVVKGEPTDDELAALVAVVCLRRPAPVAGADVVRRSEWSAHHRRARGAHRHGPGEWRRSALPGR